MSNDTFESLGLDDLLDLTLDDIEDLPSFEPFAPGAYKVSLTLTEKVVSEKPAVEAEFTLIEVQELANSKDEAPNPGDVSSALYFLDNEIGRGKFKEIAVPLATALGVSSIRELLTAVKDVECLIISSIRLDKSDKDKKYMNVKEIAVL